MRKVCNFLSRLIGAVNIASRDWEFTLPGDVERVVNDHSELIFKCIGQEKVDCEKENEHVPVFGVAREKEDDEEEGEDPTFRV